MKEYYRNPECRFYGNCLNLWAFSDDRRATCVNCERVEKSGYDESYEHIFNSLAICRLLIAVFSPEKVNRRVRPQRHNKRLDNIKKA